MFVVTILSKDEGPVFFITWKRVIPLIIINFYYRINHEIAR